MGKLSSISARHVTFGKKIRSLRNEHNWTQERLALEIGVDPSYIGFVERAERNITLDNILKLADIFEIPVPKLFE
jgi:transcriptional regulator with XRE-family HTH domain